MNKDIIEQKYNQFKDFINGKEGNGCKLITTLEEFRQRVEEKKEKETFEAYIYVELEVICGTCGEIYEVKFRYFKRSRKCCKDCAYEGAVNGDRLTYAQLVERIKNKGLKLVKGIYKNETSKITVKCRCGYEFDTTYASIRNSSDLVTCKKCKGERLREYFKFDFNKVVKIFKDNGCKVLIEEDEYINYKKQIKFIAKCGHEHQASLDSFINSKYKMCPSCTKQMNSGENTYNWKGGIYSSESERFRGTYEFKHWQKSVFKRDNYTCQLCKQIGHQLNAHHLDGYNWAIEKRTDLDNGITLCEDCHKEFHGEYGYGNNTKEQFEKFTNNKLYNKKLKQISNL